MSITKDIEKLEKVKRKRRKGNVYDQRAAVIREKKEELEKLEAAFDRLQEKLTETESEAERQSIKTEQEKIEEQMDTLNAEIFKLEKNFLPVIGGDDDNERGWTRIF